MKNNKLKIYTSRKEKRMIKKINRKEERQRRHTRVRNKISGTPERPRLCIFMFK